MKISIDLNSGQFDQTLFVEDGIGATRATARICLKTLNVLKSRNMSGSQLLAIENIAKALQKAVDALPRKVGF